MYVKIHKSNESSVIAVCDKNLINKKFESGELQLNITERFYKGEEMPEESIVKLLKNAGNLNIVGEKAIKLALNNNIIGEEHIIKIKNVPHAQVAFL